MNAEQRKTKAFAVVLLAAGSSTRLGQPKQLLRFGSETLVEHAARTGIDSGASEVIVVVGSDASDILECLAGLPVKTVYNPDHKQGIGSSIGAGVRALPDNIACVVLALVDQPLVTPDHLHNLASLQLETGAPVAASAYNGVLGVPAAFGRVMFSQLTNLPGDTGARHLIKNNAREVIPFANASVDIDTLEEYERLADLKRPKNPL